MAKRLLIVAGIGIGVVAIFLVVLAVSFRGKPSVILDFHPAQFSARAAQPFFYSIGKSLKYGDSIAAVAPTIYIIHSSANNPVASPDHRMIAFVDDGELLIVDKTGSVTKVVPVDSIYHGDPGSAGHRPKPLGQGFFRDQDYQWTRDAQNLYLIHDQFYDSKGSQLFSKYGELWKYSLATHQLQLVLKPFPAHQFFFGRKGIYFSIPTPEGDLQLRYFDGKASADIGEPNEALSKSSLLHGEPEDIFYSFQRSEFKHYSSPFSITTTFNPSSKNLEYKVDKKHLLFTSEGVGFKGPYNCGSGGPSAYLPGGQYAVLDMEGCEPFDGKLLVELASSRYMQLPNETDIYITVNTAESPHYSISGGGIGP